MGEAEEGASALYDVFINHRGPDTKRTVASLVYRRLVKYGLRVFLDQDELKIGDPLYDKIKSAVHVAIFSVRYAESAWCLNELSDMLQSGCKVIPIFYNVKPAHLRRIDKGPYAKAFRKHQDNCRYAVELVEKWKNALQKASNISGKEFISKKDDLGDLVDEIVEEVLKEAKWELLCVAEHPVGLHQAENFNNFLKERQLSGTTVVGIIGLDGSGKSTLVRHLYNCNLESRKFKRYCFLSELNKKDLAVLQHKLVRDLLGDDKYSISDTSNGKRTLRTCLKGCGPVLIVLDGLDKEEQIESLLLVVKKDVLAEGSLILVTCHDKALLEAHQVNLFYQIKLLQVQDAYDLFCWYAFDKPKPPEHLEDLVQKFVEICCGFPLALKILGRKLCVERDRRCWEEQVLGRKLSFRRDRRDWEEQLRDLGRAKLPTSIVEEILKVSYNYLEEEKKEVFLDVAHFLVGEDTDMAVRVLEGLHDTRGLMCLKEFQRKCLLDLEEIDHCKLPLAKGFGIQWRTKWSSKIRMHDLVRKMATQIASEDSRSSLPTRPLRLCQLDTRSILQVLQYKGNHVRGIRSEDMDEPDLQYQYINKLQLPGQPHAELNGLRLLVIQDYSFPFPFDRLSGDLIWLRIHKSQWGNTIPPTLLLRNLRVLELDGVKPEALGRMDSDEFPSRLCELTVDYFGESAEIPRRNLPSSSRVDKNSMEASSSAPGSFWDWFRVTELTDLVKMVLKNVRGLKSLPIDFNAVKNLRHLDLSGCFDLEKMPDSFTGLLQLQYLALQDCRSLSISDLGEIAKLEYLDFEGCSLLQKLPDKTTVQRGLRYLNLMDTNIEELPQDLGKLNKLEQLLIKSSYLTTLPRSFGELGQLRILTLSGCFNLRDISSSISIEHFPYLESLQLWDVGVMTVPQGIAWSSVKLLHVKAPHLSEFSFERDQGKMPLDRSHTQENIHDRTKSVEATGRNHVSSLTELRLVETDISNLWGSHTQESIHDRTESVEATGRNHVSSLTELRLVETDISNLWFPPEESLFPDLEIIDLSGNPRLRDVQSLPCNLKKLYLMNCTALTTL